MIQSCIFLLTAKDKKKKKPVKEKARMSLEATVVQWDWASLDVRTGASCPDFAIY